MSYTWNNLGHKTSMTVPLGYANKGRKLAYIYDKAGRQIGMDVIPVTVTTGTTLPSNAGSVWLGGLGAGRWRPVGLLESE